MASREFKGFHAIAKRAGKSDREAARWARERILSRLKLGAAHTHVGSQGRAGDLAGDVPDIPAMHGATPEEREQLKREAIPPEPKVSPAGDASDVENETVTGADEQTARAPGSSPLEDDQAAAPGGAGPTPRATPAGRAGSPGGGDDSAASAHDYASAIGNIAGAFGYAVGGPMGAAVAMSAGGLLGKVVSGKEIEGKDIAKAGIGMASGLVGGGAGNVLNALGGLLGGGTQGGGGGGEGGGGVTVGGGGTEGGLPEAVRLLREISLNIKSMVGDGIVIRGDHRRTGGSII